MLKVVSGNIAADNLDLSEDDRHELIENVNIIFHCAAVVKFDFSLMEAMKTNVKGTHRILQLAESLKNLDSLVYVSTAFSQSYQTGLEEKYYPTGFDIFTLIDAIDSEDNHLINDVQKKQVD